MADYRQMGGFVFTVREAQFARPDERGRWASLTGEFAYSTVTSSRVIAGGVTVRPNARVRAPSPKVEHSRRSRGWV